MATRRWFECPTCGMKAGWGELFSALKAVADGGEPSCEPCGQRTRLHLSFDLALGAGGRDAVVVGSFYPDKLQEWDDNASGDHVTFHPFLVVTEGAGNARAAWLPYWHLTGPAGSERKKYGQWAPFMDLHLFDSLLSQARAAGLLETPQSA